MTSLIESVSGELARRGFDLCQPFSVRMLNQRMPAAHHLPLLGRTDALGLVVGNTRALWPHFVAAFRNGVCRSVHPLDEYVEQTVPEVVRSLSATSGLVPELGWWLGFAHRVEPAPLPMQRIADATGLAPLGPGHLNCHPHWGPWIALRAVVVLAAPPPAPLPVSPPSPCEGCAAPCKIALQHALREKSEVRPFRPPPAALNAVQRLYLQIREVCPVGVEHRYDDDQISYHYARARHVLEP